MTPKQAADKLRPDFHLELIPAEERHHVAFVEAVADELGIEKSHFNMAQVAAALDHAGINPDSNEYPKMLFSREHHEVEGLAASVHDARHDAMWVHVASEEEAKKLGSGWVDDLGKLPPKAAKAGE